MTQRHVHIPVFVPHFGCPHTCVFCNQHSITGQDSFSIEDFHQTVEAILSTVPKNAKKEIAFFGGSFTAINRKLMLSLLSLAEEYVTQHKINAIRLSTRPDAIDDEILFLLKQYSVSTIELGIQSTDDDVLTASERGHTSSCAKTACLAIKRKGFTLVGQMMVGLPASTYDKERKTAEDMIAWGVDAVRIYPTVVFPNTALNTMCNQGTYSPLSVEEAAKRVGALLNIFYENEIDVIRIGLCDTEVLQKTQGLLGAYHPALGELCQGEFYRNRIEKMLAERMIPPNSHITVEVAPEALSQAIGQKRTNLIYFQNRYSIPKFTIQPSSFLKAKEVKIHMKEN